MRYCRQIQSLPALHMSSCFACMFLRILRSDVGHILLAEKGIGESENVSKVSTAKQRSAATCFCVAYCASVLAAGIPPKPLKVFPGLLGRKAKRAQHGSAYLRFGTRHASINFATTFFCKLLRTKYPVK